MKYVIKAVLIAVIAFALGYATFYALDRVAPVGERVYMIDQLDITDGNTYAEYLKRVPAVVKKYGGRYIVRGGKVTPLTGNWSPQRVVIVEFPSSEDLMEYVNSSEYSGLSRIKDKSTSSKAVIVEYYNKKQK